MEEFITDERTGLRYELVGDYYLIAGEDEPEGRPIGIWGQRHLRYIRKHKTSLYAELLTTGKLNDYLADLNEQAEELFSRLVNSGALSWIEKFAEQRNGVGKPLPAVLKRTGLEWYELQDKEIAEVFTMMNPDQRLFFAKFETPSFVNQRLIGLTHKAEYPDEELNHALLNSMFTMFYIEASGFGRGLGVLDVNKDNIAKCYMLNPNLVSATDRQNILSAFEKLKARQIMKVSEELKDEIRLDFEHIVLQSFGMEDYFDKIKSSLLSMQETRATARE